MNSFQSFAFIQFCIIGIVGSTLTLLISLFILNDYRIKAKEKYKLAATRLAMACILFISLSAIGLLYESNNPNNNIHSNSNHSSWGNKEQENITVEQND